MAKTIGIRKSLEILLKKVETLENQSFAQKLLIDELESKLQSTETTLKEIQENPFGLPTYVPSPMPMPRTVQPVLPNGYPPGIAPLGGYQQHTCTPGPLDWAGSAYCATCARHMSGPSWTITSTSDKTSFQLSDPASQSSTDVEEVLDLEIDWIVPDPQTK